MQTGRGQTASVKASAVPGAVHSLSAPATASLSTSLPLTPHPTRTRLLHYLRLTRSNNFTMTTTQTVCLLSPIPPPSQRPHLVCVEKLAASTMERRCVPAHKLVHTPRLVQPTVSPLPLSLTVGQQPARPWEERRGWGVDRRSQQQRRHFATQLTVARARTCRMATTVGGARPAAVTVVRATSPAGHR